MADVVTSQLLENGPRRVVYKFTNFSDGTGETGVVKVDPTLTGPLGNMSQGSPLYPGVHLTIVGLIYDIRNMAVRIQWDASSAVDAFLISGAGAGPFRLMDERAGFGGVYSPAVAGATGKVLFTTVGAAPNTTYTIIMTLLKNIPGGGSP